MIIKYIFFLASLFLATNAFPYGDKVCSSSNKCVNGDAACFSSDACDNKGFACRSTLEDAEDRHNDLADEYNELLKKHKGLYTCVGYAVSLEEAHHCVVRLSEQ